MANTETNQTTEARSGSLERVDRRRAEDVKLQSYGWTKRAPGEWTHPSKRGVYLKWVAIIMCKEMSPPIGELCRAADKSGGAQQQELK